MELVADVSYTNKYASGRSLSLYEALVVVLKLPPVYVITFPDTESIVEFLHTIVELPLRHRMAKVSPLSPETFCPSSRVIVFAYSIGFSRVLSKVYYIKDKQERP